ncbi:hypothetical protein H4582DRAFT_2053392 [Lactarius indigo]|nr:hypothetical protein H4582DRAFT_2053392 [Lactarius indigo]
MYVCFVIARYGKVLVDNTTRGIVVVAAVGRVLPTQLDCGPEGNYTIQDTGFGLLKASKFQLQIGKPVGTCFEDNYDAIVNTLLKLQDRTAFTPRRRNLLVKDGSETNERKKGSLTETNINEAVDAETENWPVPPEMCGELDGLKGEHRVVPLHVFNSTNFVEPVAVNEALLHSVVEVHFVLRHYYFNKKEEDSFNASIEQIVVLQSPTVAPSPYKRVHYRSALVSLSPSHGRVPVSEHENTGAKRRKIDDDTVDGEDSKENENIVPIKGKQKQKQKKFSMRTVTIWREKRTVRKMQTLHICAFPLSVSGLVVKIVSSKLCKNLMHMLVGEVIGDDQQLFQWIPNGISCARGRREQSPLAVLQV